MCERSLRAPTKSVPYDTYAHATAGVDDTNTTGIIDITDSGSGSNHSLVRFLACGMPGKDKGPASCLQNRFTTACSRGGAFQAFCDGGNGRRQQRGPYLTSTRSDNIAHDSFSHSDDLITLTTTFYDTLSSGDLVRYSKGSAGNTVTGY